MKKLFFSVMLFFVVLSINAQDFKFEKIIEVNKSQAELYSISKMFVSDCWNSAKNVTQNQDDVASVIQLKAIVEKEIPAGMGLSNLYTYKYTVKFQAKENRCRIQIYDIECIEANQIGFGNTLEIPLIQPFMGDDTDQKTKSMGKGISKKKAVELMEDLKLYFNSMILSYEKQLLNSIDDNW